MRDNKSLLLLLVSLLLVLVSFVLIWTWGYSFYTKNDDLKNNSKLVKVDSSSIAGKLNDSLKKMYSATLHDLDIQLDSTLSNSDSLKTELDIKLAEFYRLRSEIEVLLKTRNTITDFTVAKQKIGELQTKVEDLKQKNQIVDVENKKLNEVLNQISNTEKNQDKTVKTSIAVKNNSFEKSSPVYSSFTASDLRLTAFINSDIKESETNLAEKVNKLNASFSVVNFNSQLTNAELMIVVLGPDGRVLKNSGWDSGTFNTPEGKKIYSYKFNFIYSRGETKHLLFSLQTDNLIKGNYIMEIYHSGLVIGRMIKTLS